MRKRLVLVSIEEQGVYLPYCFQPNNDGVNDIYYVRKNNTHDMQLGIYKWGKVVFSFKDPNQGWDGRVNGVEQNVASMSSVNLAQEPREASRSGDITDKIRDPTPPSAYPEIPCLHCAVQQNRFLIKYHIC